jgi:NADH-quinone oxidoreductase subunit H
MAVAAYSTWAERKVAAIMQDRIGPNRTWKFGLLQPLADGGKFFFKEDFIPEKAEKFLFFFPGLVMFISLITELLFLGELHLTLAENLTIYKLPI